MPIAPCSRSRPLVLLMLAACSRPPLEAGFEPEPETETEDEGDDLGLVPGPLAAPAVASDGSLALLQEACWGVSVVDPAEPCPSPPGGWMLQGERMFADGSEGLAALEVPPNELPPTLAGFCLYRWDVGMGSPIEQDGIAMDCPAVEPQSGPSLHAELRDASRAQAGAVASGITPGSSPVTVAVVDAESSAPLLGPAIDHATAVTRIVETLACPGGPGCAVQTRKALALPLTEDGTLVDPDGGTYGVRAHVAMGIVESVQAWRQGLAAGQAPSHLVINLSLGWVASVEPGVCGDDEARPWCDDTMHAQDFMAFVDPAAIPTWEPAYPTQAAIEAVHGALLYAACQGAVIVAAAGNADEDSCNEAPLAPAAWARLATPTPTQCGAMGFDLPPQLPPWPLGEPRPLLYPVAAIDHEDEPIALTRPGSLTRLVAPGAHAVADPAPGADPMRPMTGTSAAAAAVSAGVALVWSHAPSQSPHAVFEALYAAGAPLAMTSALPEYDALLGASAGSPVRRLSLCHALGTFDPSASCDVPSLAEALEALHVAIDPLTTDTESPLYSAPAAGLHADACSWCGAPVDVQLPTPTATADHYLFSGCMVTENEVTPQAGPRLAGPQPDLPVCPECPLTLDGSNQATAYLSLDDYYDKMGLEGAWLRLEPEPAGSTPIVIDLGAVVPLSDLQGSTVRVSLGTIAVPLAHASLGVRLEDGGRTFFRSNELLLVKTP